MSNEPLIVKRVFNAPASAVWNAITNNDEMKHWYFNIAEFKPEVGFEFSFTAGNKEDEQYVHLCKVTEVEPGKKITYSWHYEGYPGTSFVTWELEPQGDKTRLTITHRGIESMAANGPDFARESFNSGWTYFLYDALAKYLEKQDS